MCMIQIELMINSLMMNQLKNMSWWRGLNLVCNTRKNVSLWTWTQNSTWYFSLFSTRSVREVLAGEGAISSGLIGKFHVIFSKESKLNIWLFSTATRPRNRWCTLYSSLCHRVNWIEIDDFQTKTLVNYVLLSFVMKSIIEKF